MFFDQFMPPGGMPQGGLGGAAGATGAGGGPLAALIAAMSGGGGGGLAPTMPRPGMPTQSGPTAGPIPPPPQPQQQPGIMQMMALMDPAKLKQMFSGMGLGSGAGAGAALPDWTSPNDPSYHLPGDLAQMIGLSGPAAGGAGLGGKGWGGGGAY